MLGVEYQVHVEGYGWTEWKKNGQVAGTTGESRRVEAIRFRLIDKPENEEIFLHGNAHCENIGWLGLVPENEVCGTTGEARKLEALQFSLVGKDADKYSIQFRSHSQDLGTQDWAKDGEFSGSDGAGLRIEAVQMIVTDKGVDLSLQDVPSFRHFDPIPVPPIDPPKPVQSLAGKVICLNPGHGGSDPGAVGNIKESDANLKVVLILGKLLTDLGARVVYTRTTDIWMALSTRAAIANNANADLFISVHHNGASSSTAHGTETICYPGSTLGIKLATLTLNGICNKLSTYRRGVIQRDDSDVTFTNMPAVITEGFFVTNPTEVAKFNAGGAELEAQGILDGILAYFG